MSRFRVYNPSTGELLEPFYEASTDSDLEQIMLQAKNAYWEYSSLAGNDRARFLETIADEIELLGDKLIQLAMAESGLPEARLIGERGRTTGQLRLFASIASKGEWVEACIDTAQPNRQPLPKADIRKCLVSVGPVVVFGASNFPLAFSTAGGDTASALAAGCSVIVKAHPSHAGTSELIAQAIYKAMQKCSVPQFTFQHVQDEDVRTGQFLVRHPFTKSVAFTGSFTGGKALFDLANSRPEPVPVFAEMGSINPVILLPEALRSNPDGWAASLAASVNLGAGQFCTNPGLIIGLRSEKLDEFSAALSRSFSEIPDQVMLNSGIAGNYRKNKEELCHASITEIVHKSANTEANKGGSCVLKVNATDFINNSQLKHEVFGPFTILVECQDKSEMELVLADLDGQLTGTVIAAGNDIAEHEQVIRLLQEKVGRLLFNGVPTGVEVCYSMHHGGPFPATTDSRFTSVGADAIKRFGRPICFQNAEQRILPDALKNENPLGLIRRVDGELTKSIIK